MTDEERGRCLKLMPQISILTSGLDIYALGFARCPSEEAAVLLKEPTPDERRCAEISRKLAKDVGRARRL